MSEAVHQGPTGDTVARGTPLSGDPDGGEASPPPELLPLDAWHRRNGARMVPFAGYEMPIHYEGIIAEHLWTRGHAGLFDVSHMGQLLVSGDGAAGALEELLPGDIAGLGEGRMRYSLLLAENGGILDDLMVTRRADGLYLVVNGATKWDDIAHLREHLPDDVTLNHLDEQALLALQGPEAAAVLARVVPGIEKLVFMTAGAFTFNGGPLWISRSGYTGEDGFEISVAADAAQALADTLVSDAEVKPIGLGARDSLRLEAGLPLHGHDIDAHTTPVAADLGFALSKRRREEGGYPGHARLMIEREAGAIVRRVGLLVEGRQPVREGGLVLDEEGSEVGRVTSGGFSPSLGRPIAMAYLPAAHAVTGAAVRLEQRGKLFAATVAPMPFVPHRYVRQEPEPVTYYYTRDHEWISVNATAQDATATVGITDYAQAQLGDIVFVEVPPAGTTLVKGKEAAVVESVKAASDVYAPVSGEVIEANAALEGEPALVNTAPEEGGWFFRIALSDPSELEGLMEEAAYKAFVAGL